MAVIAQNFAKFSGLSLIQRLRNVCVAAMDKHNVPHWVEYLNEK